MAATLGLTGFAPCSPRRISAPLSHRRRTAGVVAAAAAPAAAPVRGRNLYELLRVRETATGAEIKAAYRALAKRTHPDVVAESGSGTEEFVEINRAYATLSDPAERARYDLSIRARSFASMGGGGCASSPFRTRRWETEQCW